jgi:hypothetical protein
MKMELVKARPAPQKGMPTNGLFVLAGPPKTAKTAFMASYPGAYILEVEEGGGDRLDGRFHDVREVIDPSTGNVLKTKLEVFREALLAAIEAPFEEVPVIGIDTLDVVADLLDQEIANQHQLSSIRETQKGTNTFDLWKEYIARIQGLVAMSKECGKLVIMAAHYKPPKTDKDGKVIGAASIDLPGKAASIVLGQADIIGFTSRRIGAGNKSEFFIDFQGGPLATIGSRVRELNDIRIGPLPEKNPYAAFEDVFKKAESKSPAPAPAAAPAIKDPAPTKKGPAKR